MTRLRAWLRRLTSADSADSGFTLVELLTAMAIFGILMAMMSAAMLSGMNGVSHLAIRSEQQSTDRLVSETVTRLLRYAVAPEGKQGIELITPDSIRFYSASGFAGSNDRPNRVYIRFESDKVKMTVTPGEVNPDMDTTSGTPGDTWIWPAEGAVERVLMRGTHGVSPLVFSAKLRCFPIGCTNRPPTEVITTATLPTTANEEDEYVDSVVVTVGDPDYPENQITQQVRLQNLWKTAVT